MNEFLKKMQELLTKFKAAANEVLKKLPPIEQFEASSEMAFSIRSLESHIKFELEKFTAFETELQELQTKAPEVIKAEAEKLLPDFLSSLPADKLSQLDTVKGLIQAAEQAAVNGVLAEQQVLASRREELGKEYPAEVVASFPNELLKAENYKEQAKVVAERLSKLHGLGVTQATVCSKLAALPIDEEGDKVFQEQLSVFESIHKNAGGGRSIAGGDDPGNQPDKKKLVLV